MQHLFAPPTGLALGKVKDTADPQSRGRVKVTLLATDMDVWAPCVVPSAGSNYGVALLPKNDEIVLVAFLSPDQPFVIGSVWSGESSLPIGGIAGGAALRDQDQGGHLHGVRRCRAVGQPDHAAQQLDHHHRFRRHLHGDGGRDDDTGDDDRRDDHHEFVDRSEDVDADGDRFLGFGERGDSTFSGVVQCDTMIANSVVGTSYTPGAGNIW